MAARFSAQNLTISSNVNGGVKKLLLWQKTYFCFLLQRSMTGRPDVFIDESSSNKEYIAPFAIITSVLINEKTPLCQLTPWAS